MKKIKSILKRGLVNMGNNQLRMWGYMTRQVQSKSILSLLFIEANEKKEINLRDFNASEDQLCVSMVSTDKPYFFYALTSERYFQ